MKPPSREQCLELVKASGMEIDAADSNEETILLKHIQYLIHRAYKAGAEAMREEAINEAEHWQKINTSHKCGSYIAGAIRNLKVEDV